VVKKIQNLDKNGNYLISSLRSEYDLKQTSPDNKHENEEYFMPFEILARLEREKRYISKALTNVPRGTSVLYWPCGRGLLLPLLKKMNYKVTSMDSSSSAVMQARFYGGMLCEDCIDDTDDFKVADILQTRFDDDFFGAVIINQLFHCLPKSQIHRLILNEFQRICKGPIIVCILCNPKADKTVHYDRNKASENRKQDYTAINRKDFVKEVGQCGLIVEKWVPKYSLFSRQAYAVLTRKKVI
jgi:ubiquinone/menaquinone biosynthesis C-methylase UbiE